MNNYELAKTYFEEALRRIKTSKQALKEDAFAYCMRQSQEAVELSLKASLRLVGIEPPKWHDVGIILIENRDKFPNWFKKEIETVASISRWLRMEREPSMYGDEELGLPPQKIYTKNYAERALSECNYIIELVSKLIKEGTK